MTTATTTAMTTAMKRLLAASLCLLGLVAPAEAKRKRTDASEPKDPPSVEAKTDLSKMSEAERKQAAMKLVGEARAQFDKGNYAPAATKFEEAYRLFPVPKMFYNIGVTWEKLERNDRAVCALERFVAEAPTAEPALLAESKEKVERLAKLVGRVEVEAPAGAVLFVDGDERGVAPTKNPLCVEEGKRRVVALVTGVAPVGIDLDVKANDVLKVSLDPATNTATLLNPKKPETPIAANLTPTNPSEGEKQPIYKKWWLWTAVGVVVAGGAATGIAVALRPVNVDPPAAELGPYKVWP